MDLPSTSDDRPAAPVPEPADHVVPPAPRPLRLRFPLVCLALFWLATLAIRVIDKLYFVGFLCAVLSSTLLVLLFLGWWIFSRGLRWSDKLLGGIVVIGAGWLAGHFADPSIGFFTLWMTGFPLVATALMAWLLLARRFRWAHARFGFALAVCLTWSYFLLVREEGADSDLRAKREWRWTPTAEQEFLAHSSSTAASPAPPVRSSPPLTVSPGDWTEFRGTNRDGVIHGTTLATNWDSNPAVPLWKRAVGPAWSSLLVVGNRVFTQEQRGDQETVVGYDADTGGEIWVHADPVRFAESISGPGPRATPTFAQGRLFTLGGTGLLNCLDPATGQTLWHRDIKEPSGAAVPMWAFSSSPLVTGGRVIVYAGGTAGKSLLAYRADSGELDWSADTGASSYSSPQMTVVDSVPQCLMLHDGGLTALNPESGAVLWQTGLPMKGAPRSGQPRLIDQNQLLVGMLDGTGCSLLRVAHTTDQWAISRLWTSKALKPEFPDFVVDGHHAYGFDVGIFCCIDLSDGRRCWKDGRYGRGQVMLLADQALLLVTSETGELVLLRANPQQQQEFGRFQALPGKTWNHAVARRDRVFLRNAEQMACYAFPTNTSRLALSTHTGYLWPSHF